jgi:thymidylate kinase
MILVFEGPDGVGKTTLFKAVAKARGYKDTYVDRMFPSDIIYAKRRGDIDTVSCKIKEMTFFNTHLNVLYIFVAASPEAIKNSFASRDEQYDESDTTWQLEEYKKIYDSMLFYMNKKMIIDRTNMSIEESVEKILKTVKKYEE